jgi:hypothetical protein|nr:MAG TPA: Protein of unknown function (DUF551) [Caudoviricetes sp.]
MTKSTITREQLEEWVAQFDEDGGCDATDSQLEALIRQSLAALDSEPVAWTDEQELRDVDRGGCGYLFTVNPVTPHADERRIILLYRHAQLAPASPVCTSPSGDGSLRWPCPVHPGSSPVIPDTWIPVSERMPDENAEQQVLACFKGGDISTLYYFEGRWDDAYGIVPIRQDVTHWMPLPAAPQEGK